MIKLIGYGNPARGDDGLGPAFADWARDAGFTGLEVRTAFQLSVDDALWISDAQHVVFADAALPGGDDCRFRPARPDPRGDLGTHAASPEAVLALSRILYGATPAGFVLEIAGARFGDIREGLSPVAAANLNTARVFFERWMTEQVATPAM
jgi:hydrogenase maturation protease